MCDCFRVYLHHFIPVLPHKLSVSRCAFVKSAAHTSPCTGWARHRPPTQRYIKPTASLHRSMNVSKWLLKDTNQFRAKQRLRAFCAVLGGDHGVVWTRSLWKHLHRSGLQSLDPPVNAANEGRTKYTTACSESSACSLTLRNKGPKAVAGEVPFQKAHFCTY